MGWTKDIWDSFKNNKDGLSGRKLAAFWSITVVATAMTFAIAFVVYKRNENDALLYLLYALFAWLVFGTVCLGLVTIPELIKFLAELKNGKSNTNEPTEKNNTNNI